MYSQLNAITCLKCDAKFIFFNKNCTYVFIEHEPLKWGSTFDWGLIENRLVLQLSLDDSSKHINLKLN